MLTPTLRITINDIKQDYAIEDTLDDLYDRLIKWLNGSYEYFEIMCYKDRVVITKSRVVCIAFSSDVKFLHIVLV